MSQFQNQRKQTDQSTVIVQSLVKIQIQIEIKFIVIL